MAGDWIKMRCDLATDPAVIAVAAALLMDEDHVVGKLHRLWAWADQHTHDGNATSVTEKWIDRYIGVTGFAQELQKAGWLTIETHGIAVPHFDRHNGQSGKQRGLTLKRVRNARGVTKALPEKRREEKRVIAKAITNPLPPLPESLSAIESLWLDFLAMRCEIGKPLKPTGAKQAIAKLETFGAAKAAESLRNSIAGQWQGIFEPDERKPHASRNSIPAGPGQKYDGKPLGKF